MESQGAGSVACCRTFFGIGRDVENMLRICLSGFDNTAVAKAAPAGGLTGTVVRRMALQDWGDNWFLLALDTPLGYHGKPYSQVLIRSQATGSRTRS